jgi:succinyl-CoA synthetase beta subunit
MRLKEYQGKELFNKYNIRIPDGFVISDNDDVDEKIDKNIGNINRYNLVVKSQLLIGGRGKAGLIKFCNKKNIKKTIKELLNKKVGKESIKELLIEEKLNIKKEFYLSLTLNRTDKNITLIFSKEGGKDIEELSEKYPDKTIKVPINSKLSLNISNKKISIENYYNKKLLKNNQSIKKLDIELWNIVKKLYQIMIDYDTELVEINPLVLSHNKLIAVDSKIIIDDNALFRHPEFVDKRQEELADIEKKASKYGLEYVELDGNIAVIGNGAGLVMATLDVLDYFNGKPANFLDIGGGASIDKMEKALEIVLMKNPKGVFINIFGGITRCNDIAKGIVNYIKKNRINIPMVIRMIGTNEDEGRAILNKNNIHALDSMEECAKKIVRLV